MKRYFLLAITFCCTLSAMCEMRVSAEEAIEAAANYYQLVRKDAKGDVKAGTPEKFSLLGLADMWLVPVNDSWILVSTDKRTEAILARIPTKKKPDFKNSAPSVQYLLSCYEHDIAFVHDSCKECSKNKSWEKRPLRVISQATQIESYPSSVDSLLGNLIWHQYTGIFIPTNNPKIYNKFCPSITTNDFLLQGRAAAGCVAVAMAQIMWYWKWPYFALVPTTSGGSTGELHFYDWDIMPFSILIANHQEADMIAGLLRDCGYSVNMNYGEESTASDNDVIDAMTSFGYDASTMTLRHKWNTPGWTNYLHSEIGAGRPVYYSGFSAAVGGKGHAFVLDGYDSGHLYHVNFGWGGAENGYYYIDTIHANGTNYTHRQSAIWGIQPDSTSFCSPVTFPSILSNVLSATWGIARAETITFDGVVLNSNTNCKVYSSTSIRLLPGTEIRQGAQAVFAIKDVPCSSQTNTMNTVSSNEVRENSRSSKSLQDKTETLSVYPNPARDVLNIQYNDEIEDIRIYSIEGELVYQGKSTSISLFSLPEGIYIIHVKAKSGEILQTKFIH